jgi:UDP-N-acetyl-D-galactosamine dehydrogenase
VLAVAHRDYLEMGLERLTGGLIKGGVFADVKSLFEAQQLTAHGHFCWRL